MGEVEKLPPPAARKRFRPPPVCEESNGIGALPAIVPPGTQQGAARPAHEQRTNPMKIATPPSLKQEHDELHAELAAATKGQGPVGEAARAVARSLHPHFLKEEEFALPPLGLAAALARGETTREAASVTAMTDRLKAELPQMLAEHREIVAALRKLEDTARAHNDEPAIRLARKIVSHALVEEEVMYPAAILVGEYVKARLGRGT